MRVGVFHPGTQHSWQTARALQELDQLAWYATSIFYRADKWPYKAASWVPSSLGNTLRREFKRFYHPGLNPDLVRTFGVHEWVERLLTRADLRSLAARVNESGNRAFGKNVCSLLTSDPVSAVWGYDTTARQAFEYAKEQGVRRVLDVTIGDPRVYNRIMLDVYKQFPEFFLSKDFCIGSKRIDLLDEEYDLADSILVGSDFSKETITDRTVRPDLVNKVQVLNYCYDDMFFDRVPERRKNCDGPIKFLFLGQAGPRKGIHLLLKAFSKIPPAAASLLIVGDLQVPAETFAKYRDRVILMPTVPRSQVRDILANSDCLVLPTYFEGAGIVLYEALASGIGIIQSRNAALAAAPNVGLIIPELTEAALHSALMTVIDDRKRLLDWQHAAKAEANHYTFANYRQAVGAEIRRLEIAGRTQTCTR